MDNYKVIYVSDDLEGGEKLFMFKENAEAFEQEMLEAGYTTVLMETIRLH